MRVSLLFLCILSAAILGGSAAVAAVGEAGKSAISPESTAKILDDVCAARTLFFNLEPAFGTLDTAPGSPALPCTQKSTGGYILALSGEKSSGSLRLTFTLKRSDGGRFRVLSYGVEISTATIPSLWRARFRNEGNGTTKTVGYRNPPVVCVREKDGYCPVVVGLADQVESAEAKTEGSKFRISRPASWESFTTTELKDGVYIDLSNQFWFDALRSYAQFADEFSGFTPKPIPAQAYEPVWSCWYTMVTSANEKRIWDNAVHAKGLGFGTILIDAGWDTPGGDIMTYDSDYGDLIAASNKFPDLAGLVDRIHKELGLAVELWVSPWNVGKNAKAAPEVNDVRLQLPNSESSSFFLCPKCAKTGDFIAKSVADMFRRYHVDGVWFDFADGIPIQKCESQHTHDYETLGQGYNAAMTKISNAIREANPNALIEVRLSASNINNKRFVNVMETYDTPLNYGGNRALITYVRSFSSGCVAKMDPTMWVARKEEGLTQTPHDVVGRFMATMITAGVPAVSQDFTKIPGYNKNVIKAYLDFYHKHKKDLADAAFRPVGYAPDHPNYVLEGKAAAYICSADGSVPELTLSKSPAVVYVFNASKQAAVGLSVLGLRSGNYTWVAKNHFLTATGNGDISVPNDGLKWQAPVPVGGLVPTSLIPSNIFLA